MSIEIAEATTRPSPHDLRLSFEDSFQCVQSFAFHASDPFGSSSCPVPDDSLGVAKDLPPPTCRFARPLQALHHPKMAAATNHSVGRSRPEVATLQTRSVLAVPPGYDGFLRASGCRFVSPCSRPWDPPSFRSHLLSPQRRSIVTRGAGLLTQPRPFSSVHTLRSVSPAGSRVVSPRPVPSRRCFAGCSVSRSTTQARPQGLTPPEGPLHLTPLPV